MAEAPEDIEQPLTDAEMKIAARNEFSILSGRNLDNHSAALKGRPWFVQSGHGSKMPVFRTKQEIYRMTAWLLKYAEIAELPDEDDYPLTFEEIREWVEQHG